ncbi:MAG: mechanosensitive ion channel [Alphaproteobacteria bacterium]|nr:mechanosensitive ion channel [Alphaproteobacteria bacterium]MCD8520569.1 mechanosensitive ion channel [Alphaproteobacteria bacterium]MCD8526462.1 mechanosensitive ion channel [Alphaproteobacteria bacterium]MCD8571675.1 mechanosensitive ion channel [Alphaproteobacteria bacterium]
MIDLTTLLTRITEWLTRTFWSVDTAIEGGFIVAALLMAALVHRLLKPKTKSLIERLSIPFRFKVILSNLAALTYHIAALIILGLGSVILEATGIVPNICAILIKLLLAWVAIRTALQFVNNPVIRNIFMATIWAVAALSIFGILDQTAASLDSLGVTLGEFRLSALAVIKGAFALFILIYLAQIASSFCERRIQEAQSLSIASRVLISKIVHVALIVTALLIGITSAGIDLSLFAVFGGAVGLGVGFGLQKGISNLFSGMLLLMDQSIKPGDVLELPEHGTFGWVSTMGARYTEIITRDNKSYLIPNEDLITQRVVNWSHGDSLVRIHLAFGVHYDSDPHEVTKIAIEAAKTVDRVVKDKDPVCWITEFGDSSVNFDLRFWIKDAEGGVANVRGQVFMALWDAFKKHGIQIPYPHREVIMREPS